jgi:hypothetical protein
VKSSLDINSSIKNLANKVLPDPVSPFNAAKNGLSEGVLKYSIISIAKSDTVSVSEYPYFK